MAISKELIEDRKTIICLGAGGVGKTTMSIAIAMVGALHGKKVGLLSIDPAKRLAAALGIELGSELKKINLPGQEFKGQVHAAMLDQKVVFDELVRRFAKSEKAREQILNHQLYRAASSGFGGALEYMALAKLQRMIDSGEYDLVVLDTPPDSHALDFLSRPSILSGFMESRVMVWLIKPISLAKKMGLSRLMTMGEKLAGGLASVTGIKALQILADFLVMMQDVIEGLHKSSERIVEILRSNETAFVLITTLKSAPVRSALNLMSELRQRGYKLSYILLNRCFPAKVAAEAKIYPEFEKKIGASKNWLRLMHHSYAVSEKLKKKLNDKVISELQDPPTIQSFEEQLLDPHTIEGMMTLAKSLDA